ncbi:hypothetical protein CHLNCDRAFT_19326 [Chlorella variabilis]|uniref:tRNA(His) guanylyltransferase n=1 Tax=Chlorella variabilis TaxID=554065 RepID=E1Z4A6_CHLVA|nr:hypothetical protein CHLNCDRAFT_19326 [Chlorella variabilis]EFN59318.1 hypothetical protein CHLNCDRAFT_19326 [Chlorella variabilis]|eukprot:XP_005851420.1 hypothetical protein CHLNCDRAFT_19326 [Chlorella variabilis]
MACSKYEYVKQYEADDRLLPGCWIVVRLDGKGFTKFCDLHGFEKPNDERALRLMDEAAKARASGRSLRRGAPRPCRCCRRSPHAPGRALLLPQAVMSEFQDVRLAFGESDEYSFVFARNSQLHGRRASKLVSLVASCFSASYVRFWAQHFPGTPLAATPMFDGRVVLYPSNHTLRDYLSWRQADTHVNNLYNTCFWALVKSGKSTGEAHEQLRGTLSDYKNELLFSQFGLNYNTLPERFRKPASCGCGCLVAVLQGSIVIRQRVMHVKQTADGGTKEKERLEPCVLHCDIIRDAFWAQHPELLA